MITVRVGEVDGQKKLILDATGATPELVAAGSEAKGRLPVQTKLARGASFKAGLFFGEMPRAGMRWDSLRCRPHTPPGNETDRLIDCQGWLYGLRCWCLCQPGPAGDWLPTSRPGAGQPPFGQLTSPPPR